MCIRDSVNIGVEEEKGNALVKETYPMLKECKDINFIGSIEARDIPAGKADVVVCEAFVGNVILKLYEGVGATLIKKVKGGMMTNLRSKIGALLDVYKRQPKNYCIMQIWAESGKSALPICNYSQILYQFLTFTQNLKRSQIIFYTLF